MSEHDYKVHVKPFDGARLKSFCSACLAATEGRCGTLTEANWATYEVVLRTQRGNTELELAVPSGPGHARVSCAACLPLVRVVVALDAPDEFDLRMRHAVIGPVAA